VFHPLASKPLHMKLLASRLAAKTSSWMNTDRQRDHQYHVDHAQSLAQVTSMHPWFTQIAVTSIVRRFEKKKCIRIPTFASSCDIQRVLLLFSFAAVAHFDACVCFMICLCSRFIFSIFLSVGVLCGFVCLLDIRAARLVPTIRS